MRRCSLYFPSSVITFLIAKGKSFLKRRNGQRALRPTQAVLRSEENTPELQSRLHLVCRLLLEKKNVRVLRSFADTDVRGVPTDRIGAALEQSERIGYNV